MLSSAENQTISLSTKTWIWENLSGGGLVCKVRPEHGSAVWVAAGLHLGQVGGPFSHSCVSCVRDFNLDADLGL